MRRTFFYRLFKLVVEWKSFKRYMQTKYGEDACIIPIAIESGDQKQRGTKETPEGHAFRNRFLTICPLGLSMSHSIRVKAAVGWLVSGMHWRDFFRLKGEGMTLKEMRGYVSYMESAAFCGDFISTKAQEILCDKWQCYLTFKDYYKRNVWRILPHDPALDEVIGSIMQVGGVKYTSR